MVRCYGTHGHYFDVRAVLRQCCVYVAFGGCHDAEFGVEESRLEEDGKL